ncbi:HlpA protein [Synergistales bacterium]|nr:HlpA protein [Synergistales bacterium]
MKKIFLSAFVVSLLSGFFCVVPQARAADVVGVIESQKIAFQHPKFDSVTKELLAFRRENESATLRAIELESDDEKKADIYEAAVREFTERERLVMSPILADCDRAVQAVMKSKKITVILEKDSIYLGGTDITDDVVAWLKKNAVK